MSVAFIRTIIIYFLIVLAMRIMGKRQLGELQPSEFAVTILVSNLATMSVVDSAVPLMGTILPIFTIVSCEVLLTFAVMKIAAARKLFYGKPRIVVRDGVIDQKEMRELRLTLEDLLQQLRQKGVFEIDEVALAMVETSGTLSVFQKYRSRPLSLEIEEARKGDDLPPALIISDGELLRDSLACCGAGQAWLDGVLTREGLSQKDIFLMSCDKSLRYTILKKEGK